jgi:ATP-dependent RNA helicase DDX5/DBP2
MESYIHRMYVNLFCFFYFPNYFVLTSGRTGRAGKKGTAVSFFVPDKNSRLARELIEILQRTEQNIPESLRALSSFGGGGGGSYRPSSSFGGRGGRGGRY